MNSGKGNKIFPFRGRHLDAAKRVSVHRNLHLAKDRKFSVVQSGLVIGHTNQLMLGDCVFVVQEAGRQRVLREKRKNVHAFIRGFVADNGAMGMLASDQRTLPAKIIYNPYKHSSFVCGDESITVKGARAVVINNHGVTAAYIE